MFAFWKKLGRPPFKTCELSHQEVLLHPFRHPKFFEELLTLRAASIKSREDVNRFPWFDGFTLWLYTCRIPEYLDYRTGLYPSKQCRRHTSSHRERGKNSGGLLSICMMPMWLIISVGNVGEFVISDAKFKRSRCLLCSDIALGRSICFTKYVEGEACCLWCA